jgi:hypothetical protein
MSISRRGVVFGAVLLSVTVSGCMVGALDVDFGDHGLAEIRVIVETTPVDVRVRTDQPVDGSRRDYIVDYEITVPADFAVTGVNGNGDVFLHDLQGDVDFQGGNGSATVAECHQVRSGRPGQRCSRRLRGSSG